MSFEHPPFRATGLPSLYWRLGPSTSAAYPTGLTVQALGRAYSSWSMRVRVTGATSGQVQLQGTVAPSSSDGTGGLRPATTWDGAVNSSDDVVSVTGKPYTLVCPFLSTPGSSASYFDVWITGTP